MSRAVSKNISRALTGGQVIFFQPFSVNYTIYRQSPDITIYIKFQFTKSKQFTGKYNSSGTVVKMLSCVRIVTLFVENTFLRYIKRTGKYV